MSERTYTEREVVLREREAFKAGIAHASTPLGDCVSRSKCAAARYPLPKVTRARVAKDSEGVRWRVSKGRLQFMLGVGDWFAMLGKRAHALDDHDRYGIALEPTPERIKIWADLLARPTEDVEQD